MVVTLGPGKFYGGSLPRPRFYSDTKFNPDRVDPPLPVMEPLLSWANEAHWSMGGLSFKRLRLQGRIEGNVNKLRRQMEKLQKNSSPDKDSTIERPGSKSKRAASVSPPPAPAAVKRRRFLALSDSDSDSEDDDRSEGEFMPKKEKMALRRGAVRKLGDDFERVARESSASKGKSSNGVGLNVMKIVQEITDGVGFEGVETGKKAPKNGRSVVQSGTRTSPRLAGGTRTSPRLAKRGSNKIMKL